MACSIMHGYKKKLRLVERERSNRESTDQKEQNGEGLPDKTKKNSSLPHSISALDKHLSCIVDM